MSVTKTQATEFHDTDQAVSFKLSYIRLDNLDKMSELRSNAGFNGRVGDAPGIVEHVTHSMARADILDGLTAEEITAGKLFVAGMERVHAAHLEQFEGVTHDGSDVMA
jgi:hypothetical protein